MQGIKRVALLAAVLALGITAVGAPASALVSPPQVAIVQGMPGVRVDLVGTKPRNFRLVTFSRPTFFVTP